MLRSRKKILAKNKRKKKLVTFWIVRQFDNSNLLFLLLLFLSLIANKSLLPPLRTPLEEWEQRQNECHNDQADKGIAPAQTNPVNDVLDSGGSGRAKEASTQVQCSSDGGRALWVEVDKKRLLHSHGGADHKSSNEEDDQGHGEVGSLLQNPSPDHDAARSDQRRDPDNLKASLFDRKVPQSVSPSLVGGVSNLPGHLLEAEVKEFACDDATHRGTNTERSGGKSAHIGLKRRL